MRMKTILLAMMAGMAGVGAGAEAGASSGAAQPVAAEQPREDPHLHAITHGVANMDEALHFYRDLLDLAVTSDMIVTASDDPTLMLPRGGKARVVILGRTPTGADIRLVEIGGQRKAGTVTIDSWWDQGIKLAGFLAPDAHVFRDRIVAAGFPCWDAGYGKKDGDPPVIYEAICADHDGGRVAIFSSKKVVTPIEGPRWADVVVDDAQPLRPFYTQGMGLGTELEADYEATEFRHMLGLPAGHHLHDNMVAPGPGYQTRIILFTFPDDKGRRLIGRPVPPSAPRAGFYALSWEVRDIKARLAAAVAHGATVVKPPARLPGGADAGRIAAVIRAPNNILLTLIQ